MMKCEIAKGVKVQARDYVESGYFWEHIYQDPERNLVYTPGEREGYGARELSRWATPFKGIIVGTSHRVTGLNNSTTNRWEDIDAGLESEKRHPVVMVQPTHTPRYQKPRACLLEDLELDKQEDGQCL